MDSVRQEVDSITAQWCSYVDILVQAFQISPDQEGTALIADITLPLGLIRDILSHLILKKTITIEDFERLLLLPSNASSTPRETEMYKRLFPDFMAGWMEKLSDPSLKYLILMNTGFNGILVPLPLLRRPKRCTGCSALLSSSSSKQCSRCHAASYCTKTCQRSHWNSGHRNVCTERDGREVELGKRRTRLMREYVFRNTLALFKITRGNIGIQFTSYASDDKLAELGQRLTAMGTVDSSRSATSSVEPPRTAVQLLPS
jgi:hypothetical protein